MQLTFLSLALITHKKFSRINKETKMSLVLLQPLRWRYVKCVIHHERDVREEQ